MSPTSILAAGLKAAEDAAKLLPAGKSGATVLTVKEDGDATWGAVVRAGEHVTVLGQLALDIERGQVKDLSAAATVVIVW
jgi:hypothetical protein